MWSSLFSVLFVWFVFVIPTESLMWQQYDIHVIAMCVPPRIKQQCPAIVNCLISTANDLLSLAQVWAEWWCDHSDDCTDCPCFHRNYRLCSTQGDLTSRGLGCGIVYVVGWYRCSTLNVVLLGSSETWITTYHTVWCYNWQNHSLNLHCHGDLEFHKARFSSFTLCRML